MLAVAGAALYMVYEQTQKQPQPTSLVIQQSNPIQQSNEPKPPPPPDPGSDSAGSGSAEIVKPTKPGPKPPVVHGNPYLAAISSHLGSISQCLNDHRDEAVPTNAMIVIAPSGKVKSVTWTPDSLNASPGGACMRNELMRVSFPRDKDEATINWQPTLERGKG
jgi:hypothetical protein